MNTKKDEVFYRNIEKNDSYFSVANPFTDLTFNQTDNTLKCRGNINFTLDLNKMDMDYRINVTEGKFIERDGYDDWVQYVTFRQNNGVLVKFRAQSSEPANWFSGRTLEMVCESIQKPQNKKNNFMQFIGWGMMLVAGVAVLVANGVISL